MQSVTDWHLVRLFRERVSQYRDRIAIKYQQGRSWKTITWQQFGLRVDELACALLREGVDVQDKVAIFARNMPEWTMSDLAILSCRAVTVPIYPTSTTGQAQYIINDAEARILFVGEQEQFDKAVSLLSGETSLKKIVVLDPGVAIDGCPQAIYLKDFVGSATTVAFRDLLTERVETCDMDDLVTLIYTSGTTGEPKGVMLDYRNFGTALRLHDKRLLLTEADVSLCFLPLSHVFERAWTFYVMYRGATNAYIRDPAAVREALTAVRPTVMCAVPRFYEKIHSAILARVEQATPFRKHLFKWALATGERYFLRLQSGQWVTPRLRLAYAIADKLVFQKLRALVGGRVRFFPCAGARLADDINLFFQVIGLNIKYGYGLTETTATVSCYDDAIELGSIGKPLPEVEIRIGADNEIQVRGGTVMRGYYRKPEATNEAFIDGWFRTGDAGYIDDQGNLIMTERIKELMKTSGGKYVAPQVIEGAIVRDHFVEQVAIIADARKFVSALIVPAYEALEEYARSMGLKFESRMDLLRHQSIQDLFHQRLESLQKELARFEKVKKFTLLPREFSLDLGEMTPTLKLRRKVIMQRFGKEIEAMYT